MSSYDSESDSSTRIVEGWFTTSSDIHNLRTAIIPRNAVTGIHHVTMLIHKLLLLISLPRTPKVQAILEEHYRSYKKQAEELKDRAREEQDVLLEKEANEMLRKLELARAYNTFVDLLAPIDLIKAHLEQLVSASTAVEGRGMQTLLRLRAQEKKGWRSIFKQRDDSEI